MKSVTLTILLSLAALMLSFSCEPLEEDEEKPVLPSFVSLEIEGVKHDSATVSLVWDDNGFEITECGLVIATTVRGLDSDASIIVDGQGRLQVSGLKRDTKYYLRSFARNAAGLSHSPVESFTTLSFVIGDPVDLGLSVRWSSLNLGADTPEEYGDYFAWGETSPKSIFNWDTYLYYDTATERLTKYCMSNHGTVDGRLTLEKTDDAAASIWKGDWRMPSYEEFLELAERCTWTWTAVKGVNGYRVTGSNGNSIFLPAGGRRHDFSLDYDVYIGYYWTSTVHASYSYYARFLFFHSDQIVFHDYYRHDGFSVRPVMGS